MRYLGSKRRLASKIIPVMESYRRDGQCWVEPFVGGGNIIDKVDNPRIGGDSNDKTIKALLAIRDYVNDLPKNNQEFTERDYRLLRQYADSPCDCFAGFVYSYGGKWLGGWSRDSTKRDYVATGYRSALKQSDSIQGVELYNLNYWELPTPDNSLIYCDPPYANREGYGSNFDHLAFWEWCRIKSKEGHTVFISEYCAPKDFIPVWSMDVVRNFNTGESVRPITQEKLFMFNG